MKAKAWYVKMPGSVYANGPVRFDSPVDEQFVRQLEREHLKVSRLPKGWACWPTTDAPVKTRRRTHLFTIRATEEYAQQLRRKVVAHFVEKYAHLALVVCHDPAPGRHEYAYSQQED